MGNSTENLNLYLTDMETDGNDYFDFDRDLNENWEKIDKSFSKTLVKSKITNCILEAPNGVLTKTETGFITSNNLKVLIPNGLNPDGTLKNIEFTKEEIKEDNINFDTIRKNEPYYIYITEDGNAQYTTRLNDCYVLPSGTTKASRIIYNIPENKFYFTAVGTINWQEKKLAIIGTFIVTSTNEIKLNPFQPINLLKQTDKSQISGWALPSNKYITLNLGASGSTYTAPANGWFACNFSLSQSNASDSMWIKLFNKSAANLGDMKWITNRTQGEYIGVIPVKQGDVISIEYQASSVYVASWEYGLRFVYAEGVKE